MASGKQRRKQAKQAYKANHPQTGPFRHRDGDRRHRETMAKAVKQALAEKKAMQLYCGAAVPPEQDQEQ
jgi:hypothetical protein